MLVPLNITGGTYKHKSIPLSAQRTVNFYPQKIADSKAVSPYVLETYPGYLLFGTVAGGADRGMFEHKGVLYKVSGSLLYTVDSGGTHTSRGTIPGSGRCIFAPIGSYVVISTETLRYLWNGSTVAQIMDADLEAGNSAAHLNNQIIYDGLNGRFGVSDVGDATSVNGLNYATAESSADLLLRCYVFNQVLFNMGEKTIEPWYNSGQGNPPMDRYDGSAINVGLGAIYSVANDDENLFFFGDDDQVYVLRGGASSAINVISTELMNSEFKHYTTTSDAIGWCMNYDGQWQYHLTFPTESKTWVYNVGGEWFELSSGNEGGRSIANSYAYCFRKHLVADYTNGNIYQLDDDTYTENGSEIIRLRDAAPIHGGLFKGASYGVPLTMNRLEITLEVGTGLLSGQGSNPFIMVSFSDDGGHTFSSEIWGEIGGFGEFQQKVEFWNLGSFVSRIIRIRTSDPVHYSIYSASADIDIGIQ